jgi:hypothetical protein
MKLIKSLLIFSLVAIMISACGENNTEETTEIKEVTETKKEIKDTTKKKEVKLNDEGINVSIKGASVELGSEGGKVETKTGTDIQVNQKAVKVNSKDVNIRVGNRQ